MIYNNLLFFLVAIVLFTASEVPDNPAFPVGLSFLGIGGLSTIFYFLAKRLYRRVGFSSENYFRVEKKASILVIVFFGLVLYLFDIKYYLTISFLEDSLPSLINVFGLALLFFFFSILWYVARRPYQRIFGRDYSSREFIISNIKANIPIVLPWLMLSLLYDGVALLPITGLPEMIESVWGDLLFFLLFLFMVMIFFPPLVRSLWGCEKLPEGPLRDELKAFCEKQNFSAELYLWPLFEGRVITAGVMGFIPGLRFILLTPAIIETMTKYELEAVVAHEIGHVKKYHLLLYVFLIGGFSVFMGFLTEPALRVLFSSKIIIDFMISSDVAADQMFLYAGSFALLVAMLFYFRFVFGYFIRNFERQADVHVFSAIGNARSLISAFERLAVVSGNIRDKPSWHHFGIGERVDFLEKCEIDSTLINKQDRKVYASLLVYLLTLILTIFMVGKFPTEKYIEQYKEKYTEAFLVDKIENENEDAEMLRLAGDFMLYKKEEEEAIKAYGKAVLVEQNNPEVLNNLAWLLLTSSDLSLRDPAKALNLARIAVVIDPKGYVLDTLATAYWANGFLEEALAAAEQAIYADPLKRMFYLKQADKFRSTSYQESLNQH